ncbi:hypothetical protein MKW92_009259 [Papaver armeniacum]|nr:hypothetical protein MKW92_009259 [Papaver armeniacum]
MEYPDVSLVVFLILILFTSIIETQSFHGEKPSISERQKEDMELERQLKILNKKPIKTIMTKFGDIVDCIDIYKQPAFDHPSLKNHKIQMVPTGTVPIRRTKKEDLINARKTLQKTTPIHSNVYPLSSMEQHADGHKKTGCFNMLCSGFVQIDRDISLGADPQTGNWWLITSHTIGYWPKEIFSHLTNNASVIRYGGIAGATPQTLSPPMGNGYLPQLQNYLKTAYMDQMKYINEKGQAVNLNPYGVLNKQATSSDCYNILFAGNLGSDWEITMTYGGPGGMCP